MSGTDTQPAPTDVKAIVRTAILENEKIRKQRNRNQERNLWQWLATTFFGFLAPLLLALVSLSSIVEFLNAGAITADSYVVGLAVTMAALIFIFVGFGVGCVLLDVGDNLRAINRSIKSMTEKDEYGIAELIGN